jgi:hypothetical protein
VLRSQALFSPRVTTRIEAAVMGGRDLDRFSRFAFGHRSTTGCRAIPSALVRYDRGAVPQDGGRRGRPRRWLRLDAFGRYGRGASDPGFGPGLRITPAFGAASRRPAPFGHAQSPSSGIRRQGVNAERRRGTHVVRISGYKVF